MSGYVSQPIVWTEPVSAEIKRVNKLKEKIWSVKTVHKIWFFLWRVLSGALAVSDCLRAHGMHADLICHVCKQSTESISHVLFGCGIALQVWHVAKVPLLRHGVAATIENYMDHFLKLFNSGEVRSEYRQALPWIIWGIWKQRNGKVYDGNAQDAYILVAQALEESQALSLGVGGNRQRWMKPCLGLLKCNVCVSWLSSTQMCGGSWIVRDHRGEDLFHARDAFLPVHNRIAAELRGIIWVLQSIFDIHCEHVEVLSGCGAVVEAIRNPIDWPKYRSYLDCFSVTKEGRCNSYLAAGEPTWLHLTFEEDRRS